MLPPHTVLQDRYLIESLLGKGGMGAVYKAVDQRFGSTVALKQTLVEGDELLKAFQREAKLLNGLRHVALPVVIDYFTESNEVYLVMQYIPGEDLAQLLEKKGGAFGVEEVVRWADQLLDVLDYLHNNLPPVIHRDIKPPNIKLTERGQIILLDFGLAKGSAPMSEGSVPVSVFGYTPAYAPFEQIQGSGTDARSDIYSLSATLYHLITGTTPVDALTRTAAIVNSRPDPLSSVDALNLEVPPDIASILMWGMEINPDRRPQTAAEMRARLREASHRATNLDRGHSSTADGGWAETLVAGTGNIGLAKPADEKSAASRALAGEPTVPAGRTATERSVAATTPQSMPLSVLEIAHVLSAEIVGYSELTMDQQSRLLGRLMRIISEISELRAAQTSGQLIGLPTAEGMTLVSLGDPLAPVRYATEITRALHRYPEMKLRMGIHSGPVYRMTSIDARASVSGEAVKTAQRIMAIGDAGHILVSKSVADTLKHLGTWSKCLTDLGEHELTPGARVHLFNLYTGEAGNPERPSEFPATLPSATAAAGRVAAAAPLSSATAADRVAAPADRKRMRSMLIIGLSVLALAAVVLGYVTLKPKPVPGKPLLTTEFSENFTSLDRWSKPASGWTFAKQGLQIENQPVVGFPPEVNCKDFTMGFHLKLLNDGGAAWVLRMQDANNYYLFDLSGPGGTVPNFFLTYIVTSGKLEQKAATAVVNRLVEGGEYDIKIEVKDNLIRHTITTDTDKPEVEEAGVPRKLGVFQDFDNTFPTGAIGFRTIGGQKFVVYGLYVRPPSVRVDF